jgi:hypothetical protein
LEVEKYTLPCNRRGGVGKAVKLVRIIQSFVPVLTSISYVSKQCMQELTEEKPKRDRRIPTGAQI